MAPLIESPESPIQQNAEATQRRVWELVSTYNVFPFFKMESSRENCCDYFLVLLNT